MDGYTVLRVIGEGSFGRALLVQQESSDRMFAMKEIRLPRTSLYCDGILRWRGLMQKIKHQKGKLFPEDMILNWFTQMCLGVNHIHKKHVLHRDIKSKNIFLTQNGQVKLGDFGSAHLLSNPMAFACTYVGTPYYVPPEIWENMPYNNKSDIWSLGCILYELCTLKHPANSWKSLILKVCQGSVSPLPSHYSYELQHLIKQMFKRNPSHRPSATTLLSRGILARLIQKCLTPQIITEYGEQVLEETKKSKLSTPRKKADSSRIKITLEKEASTVQGEEQGRKCSHPDLESTDKNSVASTLRRVNREEKDDKSVHPRKASSPNPLRRQWEKHVSTTALAALENASILTSSLTTEDDTGGSVIKYSGNNSRKTWLKETPETLLNILKNADLSLAFQTYTIYRPGSEGFCLKGPLSEEAEASDSVDGGYDSVILDPERLEPRLDEEDTDFEEEDNNFDWVSELKQRAGWQGASGD
ncbi:hypothetical protein QTO34_016921 [Cnephaeus nilssonii]|uniref:non-specific serine/threonine protein kinase n=1 Tax=Cnephaeus nilssonii TaxID=3371016 RepID=A0AA40LSL5_CNENI|nr:hypothetical protein QTO34_016921 [Eptesicus nilssonii]